MLYVWYLFTIVLGVLLGLRFGRLVSIAVMIEMYQVGILVLGLVITGRIDLVLLIPGAGVLPGIGRYSGISAGGLIPPLVFVLVSILTPRRARRE